MQISRVPGVGRLALRRRQTHIVTMPAAVKNTVRSRRSAPAERTVTYRGVKIAPMSGKRSPLAQAIRDGLRTKSKQSRGEPAQT